VDVMSVVPGELLALDGRLSLRTVASVREVLHAGVRDGAGDLVLDLHAVQACDTAGLALLLSVHRLAAASGRRLVLTGVPPVVTRALLRSRLHRVLTVRERTAALV